jgi:hypothetical protein
VSEGFEIVFGEPTNGRRCGSCTLCCKLVPVRSLGKQANTRCRFQCSKGCRVYPVLERISPECRSWSCRWLVDPDATGLRRPDRVHYVIDLVPDFIGIRPNGEGDFINLPVVQVWADPAFPDAWRQDQALKDYMLMAAEKHKHATLVRQGNVDGTVVFPPPLCSDGEWHERTAPPMPRSEREWVNPLEAVTDRTWLRTGREVAE